jgi:hypothetical protein
MPTGTYSELLAIAGLSMTRNVSKSADTAKIYGDASAPINLPAANAIIGANYTNDADSTATITATAGHTLVTGKADLYWAAGVRYGCDITVAVNAVDLSGGAGDAIPATGTACTLANQVTVNAQIDGDNAKLIGVSATKRTHVDFQDVGNATIRALTLQANEPSIWDSDQAGANPYTGNPITHAHVSNGDSAAAATLQILSLEDSTP